jgi:hypothetical protein
MGDKFFLPAKQEFPPFKFTNEGTLIAKNEGSTTCPCCSRSRQELSGYTCCDYEEFKSITSSTSEEPSSRDVSEFNYAGFEFEHYAGERSRFTASGPTNSEKISLMRFLEDDDLSSAQNDPNVGLNAVLQEQEYISSNFKFLRIVSETLQGTVYQVQCLKSGRSDLALKYTTKKKQSKCGFTCFEDTQREFEILRQLQQGDPERNLKQNHVITAWDFFEDEDGFFTVMDLAKGDLFDVVKAEGILDENQARRIMKQICKALSFLQTRGICHLDVSLENILLDPHGNCYLSDFGLAQEVQRGSLGEDLDYFGPEFRPGKPKYMAPEIVRGEIFNGFQADMYSLGIVLFCMLYGFHPYQQPSHDEPGYVLISCGFCEQLLFSIDDITISEQAQDLLCTLLCPEAVRLSLEEVLCHEWLQ